MAEPSSPSGISALLRGVRPVRKQMPQRPDGKLVWLNLPDGTPVDAILELNVALEGVHLLVTHTGAPIDGIINQPSPGHRRSSIDTFLAHWQPDLLVWGRPENGLGITRRAKRTGLKMMFADVSGAALPTNIRNRQLTEFLRHFEKILLSSDVEKARFAKLDLPEGQIVHCNKLSEIAKPLPENEAMLRRISGAVGPRPVWCAALVSRGEMGALLAAHRHAVNAIPNLILVVVPRAAEDVIAKQIEREGWRLTKVSPDTLPDKQVEVLLAASGEDLGAWLRLATVSYMGGTLYGPEAAEPFGAAALGSAVLCGPFHAPFSDRYARLHKAGALALVETNGALAAKLVETMAPDASAELALAAWKTGSEGAEAVGVLTREIFAIVGQGTS